MSDYRDIGYIQGQSALDIPVNTTRYTQVYQATHDSKGSLSLARRSFISFSFGGKLIEDFNLIATVSGDRMERAAYAPFEENTTTSDRLPGQQYWGTHYQANTLSFTLATDGMDQRQIEDFRYWFRAGETRELILSEHPNRGILARVSDPPQFSLLPFEANTTITISSETYKVKTTLYKGTITLNFVMDEPHWYSIQNLLGKVQTETIEGVERVKYVDLYDDVREGREISIFASEDALKILYEDGIPLGSMIQDNMLLGNNTYATVENDVISLIWSLGEGEFTETIEGEDDNQVVEVSDGEGARIDDGTEQYGVTAGAIIDASGKGISSFERDTPAYFYYSGTAPAPTQILFTMDITFDIATNQYIIAPASGIPSADHKYDTITITGITEQKFKYTSPNIITSYNKAVQLLNEKLAIVTSEPNAEVTTYKYSWEDIRTSIRDNIRHARVREWALKVIDFGAGNNDRNAQSKTIINYMPYMFKDSDGNSFTMSFSFNSETGEAIGIFNYRTINDIQVDNWATYGTILSNQKEDVGDMLLSNYLVIRDRNRLTTEGRIVKWENNEQGGKLNSHKIQHDSEVPLQQFMLLYKNMYL